MKNKLVNKIPCTCGHMEEKHESIALSFHHDIMCMECYTIYYGIAAPQSCIHAYKPDTLKYMESLYHGD